MIEHRDIMPAIEELPLLIRQVAIRLLICKQKHEDVALEFGLPMDALQSIERHVTSRIMWSVATEQDKVAEEYAKYNVNKGD